MRKTSIGITLARLIAIGLMLGNMSSPARAQYQLGPGSTLTPTIPNAMCLGWAFSTAGRQVDAIVVGDLTGQIRVFRKSAAGNYLLEPPMQDLARHPTFSDRADALLSLRVFAPDSGSPGQFFVIAGGVGQSARVWSLASKSLAVALQSPDAVSALAVDSASDWGAAAMSNKLSVWSGLSQISGTSPKPVALVPVTDPVNNEINIKSLLWRKSAPQELPVAALVDGTIALWPDLQTSKPNRIEPPVLGGPITLWSLPAETDDPPSPETLTSIGNDGILRAWDPNAAPPTISLPANTNFPKTAAAFALSDDGSSLAIAVDKTVTVWSGWAQPPINLTQTQVGTETSDPAKHVETIKRLAIDQGGQSVAITDASGQLWLAKVDPSAHPVAVDTLTKPAPNSAAPTNPGAPAPPPIPLNITSLALSADAGRMAVFSSDNQIHVYNTSGAVITATTPPPAQPVTCLAFFQTSDAHWLASAGGSRIDFWNVESVKSIKGPFSLSLPSGVTGQISALDFAGDWSGAAAAQGKFKSLIVGTDTGKIVVSKWPLDAAPWNDTNPAWPQAVLTLQASGKKIVSLHMQTSANQLISVSTDSAIRLWDVTDLSSEKASLVQRQVFTQRVQPDQAWLLTPDASGRVNTILSVAAGQQPTLSQIASLGVQTIASVSITPDAIGWIALGPEGKYLLLSTGKDNQFDGTLYERDGTGAYSASQLKAAPSTLTAAVLTTDEQHLILGSRDGTVHCYSAKSPNPRQPEAAPVPTAVGVKAVIAAFDAVVVVRLDDGSLWSIDFTTPNEASPTKVSWPDPELSPRVFSALAFVPGSNNLLAAAPDPKTPTQNQQVLSLTLGAWLLYGTQTLPVQSSVASNQGDRRQQGAARNQNLAGDPKPLGKHRGPIYAFSFDPATRRLATAAGDGIVRVWQTEKFTGRPIMQFAHCSTEATLRWLDLNDPLGTAAYGVAFGNHGPTGEQLLATAGTDGSVKFWDVSKPDRPAVTVPSSSPVLCLDRSEDGSAVVVGHQDRTITFFDFAKVKDYAKQPPTSSGPVGDEVRSIAFDPSPDAKNDVVGLIDGKNELVLWSRSSGRLASQKDCCAFAWKPDGSQIVTASPSGVITIFTVGP
jgi:WD40 repeat protein